MGARKNGACEGHAPRVPRTPRFFSKSLLRRLMLITVFNQETLSPGWFSERSIYTTEQVFFVKESLLL